jgi:Flp pilus assembly protein TadD
VEDSVHDHLTAAVRLQPDDPSAHCALGSALQAARRFKEAVASFQRAADLAPDCVDALVGQGECSLELGDCEDARDCFEIALAHAPGSGRALCGLGRLLRASGDVKGSIRNLQEALCEVPANANILFELGLSFNSADDTAAAIDAYQRALAVEPRHHGALVNLGLVYLTQLGDPCRAQQYFETAAAAFPDSVAAQANLGLALQEQGHFDLALAHYERLIAQYPHAIEYRWNRGLTHLTQGDNAPGWEDYELRHVRGGRDVRRDFGLREWDGGDPARHHVLVYAEQGLGDEIMFASCLPELARSCAGVVLECDTRLLSLFARSFPSVTVRGAVRDGARDWLSEYPALDRQIAIGSLPRVLRRRREDFPQHAGYLVPDATRVEAWQQRLAGGADGVLAVGLSWRGGTRKTRAGLRSLELRDFLPLSHARQCRFVCLQRGDCADEIAAARAAGMDLQWWPQALDDIEETAALTAALDCVISVDNTIVHLAGAMGRRCWVLLAHVPDWRYGLAGETMPWYPSLRLFRQSRSREWPPVMTAVAAALAQLRSR